MKRFRSHTARMMVVMATLLAALITLSFQQSISSISAERSAQSEVDEVWQRAQQIGTFEYSTSILQTTWPTERLENVGLSSTEEQLYIEGQSNRAEDSMQMKLWSQGGSLQTGRDAIEIKVENDKALGRVGEQEWEEVDDFTELFAPDQDHLTYLAGAKNVTKTGTETRAGITFTRYTFDVDGLAFAEYMREQMEEEMRRKGELPAGLNLDLVAQYVDMTGTGELWVDSEGLPLRQIVDIEFPPQKGAMEWYEAKIETDFSNWAKDPAASAFFGIPRLLSQHDWQRTGFSFGLTGLVAGMIWLMLLHREKKPVYSAFVAAIILSMVFGPSMQAHQTYAFSSQQTIRRTDYEQERAQSQTEKEEKAKAEAALKGDTFDPHVSPVVQGRANTVTDLVLADGTLSASEQAQAQTLLNPATAAEGSDALRALGRAATAADDEDDDNDGLSNSLEITFGTVLTNPDTDGDGLKDGTEVYDLGTNPIDKDSDGDQISDHAEVVGFQSQSGKQWYLNPLAPDSNGDGRLDMSECLPLIDGSSNACPDIDNDGTPDVYDFDDDGDGVPDAVDSAPSQWIGNKQSGLPDQTFNFRLNQFEANKPLLVDIELRPTNAKHLWYHLNVLDWPSNDQQGQVQRVKDDTFGDSGKSANGDLRLIPLLEIKVPYKSGHFGNLPVKAGFTGSITPQTKLETWLDKEKLKSYGITVSKKNEPGDLLIYVPLNLVQDEGGNAVAFTGRIYYQPNSTDFGHTQKMRLAWMVEAKVDSCPPETYCENHNNWTSNNQIIHTYYDDWFVTGLTVREEHGIDVGVVFENQSVVDYDAPYEKNLWAVANGLQDTFLAGRQDINVDEIKRRFDKDSNSQVSDTERWNIPRDALQVETFDFNEQGELGQIPITHTKEILSEHFPNNPQGDVINLLFVREERYRASSLEGGSDVAQISHSNNGLILTLNPTVVQEEVLATMNWAPYRHKGAGTWQAVDLQGYWDSLGDQFAQIYPFAESQNYENAGRVFLAKSYYLSLFHGATSLIDNDYALDISDNEIAYETEEPLEVSIEGLGDLLSELPAGIEDILDKDNKGKSGLKTAIIGSVALNYLKVFGEIELNETQVQVLETAVSLVGHDLLDFLPNKIVKSKEAGVAVGAILVAAGLAAAALTFSSLQSKEIGYVLSVASVAIEVGTVVSAVVKGVQAIKDAKELADQFKDATKATAVMGLVINIALQVGLFVFSVMGLDVGSAAFNQALMILIAEIITAVILFAIGLIPVVGQIIVAILALLDALISAICKFTGNKEEFEIGVDVPCDGISGEVSKFIAKILYNSQPLADLQANNRIKIFGISNHLVNTERGMSVGNQVEVEAKVNTNLFINKKTNYNDVNLLQSRDSAIYESTFKYELEPSDSPIANITGIGRGQTRWETLNDGNRRGTITQTVRIKLNLDESGINVKDGSFSIAEGYVVPIEECFKALYVLSFCITKNNTENTNHTRLDEFGIFDIFPPSLSEFYSLSNRLNDGFALAWDGHFPVLMDADGDGLRSKEKFGNDPDDSKPDTDQDGLSDFWEIENGYEATYADMDNDRLSDYWEQFYGTDPRQADTDNDGLLDGEEVFHQSLVTEGAWEGGWHYVYAFDSEDNPLHTLVTSDPLKADTDGDQILDKLEKVYGLNPRVNSGSDILSIESQISIPSSTQAGVVKPGESVEYQVTVENHLRNRYALGLLEFGEQEPFTDVGDTVAQPEQQIKRDFGGSTFSDVQPQPYQLGPREKITITEELSVISDVIRSQPINLIARAGAQIADLSAQNNQISDNRDLSLNLTFDGNINDRSFYTIPMRQYSGQRVRIGSETNGVSGRYGIFNRNAAIIAQGLNLRQGDNSFTIAAWLNPSSSSEPNIILGSKSGLKDLSFSTKVVYSPYLRKYKEYYTINMFDPDNESGEMACLAVFSRDFTSGWKHVVLTHKAGSWSDFDLYINGKEFYGSHYGCRYGATFPPFTSQVGIGCKYSNGSCEGSYRGGIDELKIYKKAMNSSEVETLYEEASIAFEMPFNEAPGRDVFQDISDSHLTGTCADNTCPDSGIPGRANQALRFDGEDDHVDITVNLLKNGYALSLWFKTECANCGLYSVDNDRYPLYLSNGRLCSRLNNTLCTPAGTSYADNKWHHLVHTFSTENYRYHSIYIDGIHKVGQNEQDSNLAGQRNIKIGFSNDAEHEYFRGLLDEVQIIRQHLWSSNQVKALMQKAPIFNLHFDEGVGATTFNNDQSLHGDGICTGEACPQAGTKGQIREAVLFDGQDDLITLPIEYYSSNQLSIALWVKPTQHKSNYQSILEDTDYWRDEYVTELGITEDNQVILNCWHDYFIKSTKKINRNQWNHIVITLDKRYPSPSEPSVLYLNGTKDKTSDRTSCFGNDEEFYIGGNSDGNHFKGGLDELAIYGQVFSEQEVKALYDYQVAWYDTTSTHEMTVDAEVPTMTLTVDQTYIPKRDMVMAITADDLTSAVEEVEVQIGEGSWQAATRNEKIWTFTYQPSGAAVETINVRGKDSVGNIGESSKSFIVDDSPPVVTLDASLSEGVLALTDENNESLTLSGIISDDSSGVESLYVDLLDDAGQSANTPQLATVTGNSWQVDYQFIIPPHGPYTVTLEALDRVGNSNQQGQDVIRMDTISPQADVTVSDRTALPVGSSISGTVSDIPYPTNPLLHLHFEEGSGESSFHDGSSNHYIASCLEAACPMADVSGQYGQAVTFSGNQGLMIPKTEEIFETQSITNTIDQLSNDLTVMAWVKPNSTSGTQYLLSSATSQSNDGFAFALANGGLQFITHGVNTYNTSLVALESGEWRHLAAVMDYENNVTFYVDGIAQETIEHDAPGNINEDDDFFIGSQDGSTGFFNGSLDEVVIYGRALIADQIYDIANPVMSPITNAEIGLRKAEREFVSDYTYTDSNDPEGPTYNFEDISESGTLLPVRLYRVHGPVPLGFTFNFYGEDYTQLYVSPNGFLTVLPRQPMGCCGGHAIPSTGLPNGVIAGWWEFLNPNHGTVHYETKGTAPNRYFIVQFTSVPHAIGPSDRNPVTMQFKLFEGTDIIEVHYESAPQDDKRHSAGIENQDGTSGLQYYRGYRWPLATPLAVRYEREIRWAWEEEESITWSPISLNQPQSEFSTWSYQLPSGVEGTYQLYLRVTDEKGLRMTYPAAWNGLIGTGPTHQAVRAQADVSLGTAGLPEISISTEQITSQNVDEFGFIEVTGLLTGTVNSLEVKLDDGEWQAAPVPTDTQRWVADLYSGSNEPFTGQEVTLSARASNESGEIAEVSKTVFADAAPPADFSASLSYQDSQGVTQVVTPGITLDDVSQPLLTVDWEASSDQSGIVDYLVEWVEMHENGAAVASEVVDEDEELSASFTAEDLEKLFARVTARDAYDNQTTVTVGPVYIDYQTTPVLILWDEWGEPYRAWTENACNLLGTDYRIQDNSSELAALNEAQNLYTSWDEDGLRLAWTGANWDHDGDLFIYLDTKEGGTEQAYNPYPATITDTLILLPVEQAPSAAQRSSLNIRSLRQLTETNQLAADYMIWAQSSTTATLMIWEDNQWQVSDNEWQYLFEPNLETPTTDIYLPFFMLGIEEPASASLGMVAFASEEEGLRLWSTMPTGNNLNSERVVESTDGFQNFALTQRYEWASLGEGICPSGVQPVANSRAVERSGDAVQFTGADVRAAISAAPLGIGYSVLGDNLTGAQSALFDNLTDWDSLQEEYCQANPAAESCQREPASTTSSNIDFNAQEALAAQQDVSHDLLGDQEEISYNITLFNRGSQPATGVVVDVATWGPIILPEGEYVEDDQGEFYNLLLNVGTLAAGERRTVSFTGQTDFSFDPDNNEGWATIDAIVYDDSGSLSSKQIDWLYLDHQIDHVAPDYIEIQSPQGVIGPNENTISGFVFDQSAVPTLTMEVEDAAGEISSITCPDETPRDKQWSCTFDAEGAKKGNEFKIRLKATDIHGQESRWFDWQSFTVDSTPPSISLSLESETALTDTLIGPDEAILSGALSDERLINRVEVCQMVGDTESCDLADMVLDTTTLSDTTYIYDDQPTEPIAIGSGNVCESGNELVRTIIVSDSFTIADLDVGLALNHTYRNDIDVYLKSPAGTEATLISINAAAANLDVLLDDASPTLAILDKEDHDTTAPYYENQRGAHDLLTRFNGEEAAGTWEMTICDYYPEEDDGAYLQSRLIFTADRKQENTAGTWQYNLLLDDNIEREYRSLTIYAVDEAGNRSDAPLELNFNVDTAKPTMNELNMPTSFWSLQPELELSGAASDASGIRQLQLSILDPRGTTVAELIETEYHSPSNFATSQQRTLKAPAFEVTSQVFLPLISQPAAQTTWVYSDTRYFNQVGSYTLWIEAEDYAGNQAEFGPYEVEGLPVEELYLPLLSDGREKPAATLDLVFGAEPQIMPSDVLTPTSIQILNLGPMTVTNSFRVDLYFNPTDFLTPTVGWDDLSEYGGYWLVDELIAPNQAITLTLDSPSYQSADSNHPTSFEGGFIEYAIQLDTMNQINETHELRGEYNNNIIQDFSIIAEEVPAEEPE